MTLSGLRGSGEDAAGGGRELSALFVGAGKSDRVRELLKSQGIDEGPMTPEASQALYKEEAPVWAEPPASLGRSRR